MLNPFNHRIIIPDLVTADPKCAICGGIPTPASIEDLDFCAIHWAEEVEKAIQLVKDSGTELIARDDAKQFVLENANPDNYPSLVEWARAMAAATVQQEDVEWMRL